MLDVEGERGDRPGGGSRAPIQSRRIACSLETAIMTQKGAEAAGIDFCAVLWGFGFSKMEDAAQFTCRYIAEDVPTLERFLLK